MRILLDTNLWVSALLSVAMRTRIGRLLANPNIEMLADAELFSELEEVCHRPKFARYISLEQVSVFLQILHKRVIIITPISEVQVCRDPDDDYLLAICLDGNADFLLTGDNDLLALSSFGNTRILTITEFETLFPEN